MIDLLAPRPAVEGGIDPAAAIRFIWEEAELLDRHDYLPWLALWAEGDSRYVIPIDRTAEQYDDVLNIAYDDAAMREARVKRLRSGFSMSAAPPARTVRTVSRFVLAAQDDRSITLRAAQHIVEYKYDRTRLLGADMTYVLVRAGAGEGEALKLHRKVAQLVNSDDALHGIGYLF